MRSYGTSTHTKLVSTQCQACLLGTCLVTGVTGEVHSPCSVPCYTFVVFSQQCDENTITLPDDTCGNRLASSACLE